MKTFQYATDNVTCVGEQEYTLLDIDVSFEKRIHYDCKKLKNKYGNLSLQCHKGD